jgi:hypothetical protein
MSFILCICIVELFPYESMAAKVKVFFQISNMQIILGGKSAILRAGWFCALRTDAGWRLTWITPCNPERSEGGSSGQKPHLAAGTATQFNCDAVAGVVIALIPGYAPPARSYPCRTPYGVQSQGRSNAQNHAVRSITTCYSLHKTANQLFDTFPHPFRSPNGHT